jgi:hypothetical protein
MNSLATRTVKLLRRCFALAAFFLAPSAIFAQSCAMCYQTAAASGARTATALRHGILIMLFPPLLIFAGIIVLAHRRRNDTLEMDEPIDSPEFEEPADFS